MFCFRKTLVPVIDGQRCEEGENACSVTCMWHFVHLSQYVMGRIHTLEFSIHSWIDQICFIVIQLVLVGLLFYAAATALRRYRRGTFEKFQEIANRQLNPAHRA